MSVVRISVLMTKLSAPGRGYPCNGGCNRPGCFLFFCMAFILFIHLKFALYMNTANGGLNNIHHNDVARTSITDGVAKGIRAGITGEFDDLVLWSSDFHISPIADISNIVQEYGVKVIDKSLSEHCYLTKTCQRDLRIIDKRNGISLGASPNTLIKAFYDSYKNDPEMKTVSAYLCLHATSMCELFMPLNKSMIVIASTR